MEEKTQRLEASRARYKRVKQQLETEERAKGDVEKEAQSAEDYVKSKEAELTAAEKELTSLKEKSFRKSQELFKLRQEEASLIAQISGSQAASKNLSSKIHKLDEQSLRQQELIYNSEFEIQQLERKVARASGERSDEETKVRASHKGALQPAHTRVRALRPLLTRFPPSPWPGPECQDRGAVCAAGPRQQRARHAAAAVQEAGGGAPRGAAAPAGAGERAEEGGGRHWGDEAGDF